MSQVWMGHCMGLDILTIACHVCNLAPCHSWCHTNPVAYYHEASFVSVSIQNRFSVSVLSYWTIIHCNDYIFSSHGRLSMCFWNNYCWYNTKYNNSSYENKFYFHYISLLLLRGYQFLERCGFRQRQKSSCDTSPYGMSNNDANKTFVT